MRVRQKMQWDLVLSDKAFTLAIKCIAFDERQGDAWVGDEGGHVKVCVIHYGAQQQVECCAQVHAKVEACVCVAFRCALL